jgi:hypothetical protein
MASLAASKTKLKKILPVNPFTHRLPSDHHVMHVRCHILAASGQPNGFESSATKCQAIGEGAINHNIETIVIGYLGLGIEMQYIVW